MGSYNNTVVFEHPVTKKRIQLDKCIAKEIWLLWNLGVTTIESCCGHNKVDGYIAVAKESVPLMKFLTYEKHHNPYQPDSEQFFKPIVQ